MAATYSSLVGLSVGGKYEIRRVLGAGGMGVVCEALHLDLGKRVALKLIDKSMKESELIVARFRREAQAAGRISSEHIVDVFDVGADARIGLYMVMELLRGEDLQARLERERRIDPKVGVMIAHQIARGLMRAHQAGVIHRDLKPANIFLTTRDNGQMLVKVLDFGVSKLLGEPGSARITGSGTPIGTPLYMSPEQAEGRADIDGRADVWSLGAVLYEALAGVPPFLDKGGYHATIVGIMTSRPALLHDAAPWVPAELAEVVDAMLLHDRDARVESAAAVGQRLLEAFPGVPSDGTGQYTALAAPHSHLPVDTASDTEIFDAALVPELHASMHAPSTGGLPSQPAVEVPRAEPSSTQTASHTGPREPRTHPLPDRPSAQLVADRSSGAFLAERSSRGLFAERSSSEFLVDRPSEPLPLPRPSLFGVPPTVSPSSSTAVSLTHTPRPLRTSADLRAVRPPLRFADAYISAAIVLVAIAGYLVGRSHAPIAQTANAPLAAHAAGPAKPATSPPAASAVPASASTVAPTPATAPATATATATAPATATATTSSAAATPQVATAPRPPAGPKRPKPAPTAAATVTAPTDEPADRRTPGE